MGAPKVTENTGRIFWPQVISSHSELSPLSPGNDRLKSHLQPPFRTFGPNFQMNSPRLRRVDRNRNGERFLSAAGQPAILTSQTGAAAPHLCQSHERTPDHRGYAPTSGPPPPLGARIARSVGRIARGQRGVAGDTRRLQTL